MSPEQLRGHPTPASDVYALAALAYELLTGRPPFAATTDVELLEQQRLGLTRLPSALRPELSSECDALIVSGLAFEARRRPVSPLGFTEDLAAVLLASEQRTATPRRSAGRPGRRRLIGALVAVVLTAAGAAVVRWPRHDAAATTPQVGVAGSALEYAIVVQRFRDGRAYRAPFSLPGPMLFAVDDHIRLAVSSPRDGFLYVLNEGPTAGAGLPRYNLLFPSTSTRAGSAWLPAGESIQIPGATWLVFDEEQGTERLWLVWAAAAVPELEDLKGAATPAQRGEIRSERQRRAVGDFLVRQRIAAPTRDAPGGRTRLQGGAGPLVGVIDLEHR